VLINSQQIFKYRHLNIVLNIILLTCITGIIFLKPSFAIAASQTELFNPLTSNKSDPLLPLGSEKRPLTSFEKYRIEQEIIKLNKQAQAKLKAGKINQAFNFWYRQLRLTRAIDPLKEVVSLGNVGAIAWSQNRGIDTRIIANRLTTIEQEASAANKLTPLLSNKLAVAYQQVRYPDQAINIYRQILINSKKRNNLEAIQKNLEVLGKLYLARFDYVKAANIYQELLTLASSKNNKNNQLNLSDNQEETYLNNLIDIYNHTSQTNKAISTKQRLIEKYTNTKRTKKLAESKIAIALDYQLLAQPEMAIKSYQQAFNSASATQQLAIASEALTKLAELYQQSDRSNDALQTYDKLIKVQKQSDNSYGLMDTYDRLGQIYWQLDDYAQAKTAFQQGLKLAESLNYKIKYFNNRINQVDLL